MNRDNMRVAAKILEFRKEGLLVQGIAHDLTTNRLITLNLGESTVDENGNSYPEERRIEIARSAMSRARAYAKGVLIMEVEQEEAKDAD